MKFNQKILSLVAATALFTSANLTAQELMEPTGLDQIKDIVKSDEKIKHYLEKKAKLPLSTIDIAMPSIDGMNTLIKEAIKARALVNDGELSVADVKEINNYLVENYSEKWYELRGVNAGNNSTGFYAVNRKNVRSNTVMLDTNAVNMWGQIYNLGFQAYSPKAKRKQFKVNDYTGEHGKTFTTVAYWLSEIMQADIASGELNNPDYEEVKGTTETKLDMIAKVIFNDKGLLKNISMGDMREGIKAANQMNHLIKEAIITEGLGNDGKLTTADIREINRYLVENHADKWKELHGDDEDFAETGYHLLQNDGAYTRIYADNLMNTVADGIYHLGFYTDKKDRLLNEDGNKNQRFEKVAWWLDTSLKSDLLTGKFNNPEYKEVVGTTGTTFDKIIPYIYNEEGLLRKVSIGAIREASKSANAMNELIVEAIKETDVASDSYITTDEVKLINEYLVANYQSKWIELHGDDENAEESGYHRIQNNGALGTAYNKNTINTLADGVYHLGFYTDNKNRLLNEDGNANASFRSVAYWLNKSLKEDFEKGLFTK